MARLLEKYKTEVLPQLREQLKLGNVMAVPRLQKIVISMGIGAAIQDKKRLEKASKDLTIIAGQRPAICKARKSVSNFKLRDGMSIGLKVTLRGTRMYEFLDRLINTAIPRVRDFRGLSTKAFDGSGNYSMGVNEQSVFPEIDAAAIEWPQGMNITFVTSAKDDIQCRELLRLMGMPFQADRSKQDGQS